MTRKGLNMNDVMVLRIPREARCCCNILANNVPRKKALKKKKTLKELMK